MKKIISFLLAVAMLVAFIPTAFAAEATLEKSGVKVVYDVRNVMKTLQMPSLGAAVQMTAINYDETKGFFEWLPGNTGHYAGPTSAVFTYKQVADGTQCFGMASDAKLSFEINVPKAGIYDFEMYNCVESTAQLEGKAINVYLSRDGITTADADKIGSYTCYDATVEKLTRVSTPNVFKDIAIPEAGKYTVTFTTTSARWYYNNVGTFVFNGGDKLVPMIDSVSCDKKEIMVGEDAKISASSTLMSDYATAADGVAYSYASSDERVAKVASDGTVTGIGMGEAEIYVTAEKGGLSSTSSVDIKVNSENASGVTAVFDMIKGARESAFPWNKEESFLRNIDYASTNGFWRYHSTASEAHLDYHKINNAYGIYLTGTSEYIAIGINVPKSGEYIVRFTHGMASSGSKQGAMWILPGDTKDISSALTASTAVLYDINYYQSGSALGLNTRNAGVHYLEKGENIVVYKVIAAGSTAMYPGKIELIGGDEDAYSGIVSVDKTELKIGDEAKASAKVYMSDDWTALSDYTFKSSNEAVASVAEDGTVIAKAAGRAYITAECESLASGNVVGAYVNVEADKPAIATSNVSFAATTNVDGEKVAVEGIVYNGGIGSVLRGKTIALTAPEIEGYTFVGWKRGSNENGRFINKPESFEMTLLTNTYLTAVYEKNAEGDEKKIEYYNENGDYIETLPAEASAPSVPTLAGYVFSGKWFVSEEKELDISSLTSTVTRAVAKHNAKSLAGDITVDGASVGAKEFNEEINLSAKKSGFTSWKRDGKIVSYDRNYTYYAWNATDIVESEELVSEAKLPIVIMDKKTVDGAVMIEYDEGDYEIVEAGIVFGTNATVESCDMKFTSQRNVSHGQFAAKADGNARGYVIYHDGENYRVIYTD